MNNDQSPLITKILGGLFDKIRELNKFRVEKETKEVRYIKQFLKWKFDGKVSLDDHPAIFFKYALDYIEKNKFDNARNDSKYTFRLPVNKITNKQDEWVDESKHLKVRYVLKDLLFTNWLHSQALFCDVIYKIKIFRDDLVVLSINETFQNFNMYTELNDKVARSRTRFINWNLYKHYQSYTILESEYDFIDELTNKKVINGILTDMNYYDHHRYYILQTKFRKKFCKRIFLDVIPIIKDIIYIPEWHPLNTGLNSFPHPTLYSAPLPTLNQGMIVLDQGMVGNLQIPQDGVFYDASSNQNKANRYRIRTLPTCQGIKSLPDRPSDTLERFLERGEFNLFFLQFYLTDELFNLAFEKFDKAIIQEIPLSGMYVGTDDDLFNLCAKLPIDELKRDMLKLKLEFERNIIKDGINVYSKLNQLYNFLRVSLKLPELVKFFIEKYFTFAYFTKFDDRTIYHNGIFVWKWIRTSNQKSNDIGLNFRQANTIEDGAWEQDFSYSIKLEPNSIETLNLTPSKVTPVEIKLDSFSEFVMILIYDSVNYEFIKIPEKDKLQIDFSCNSKKNELKIGSQTKSLHSTCLILICQKLPLIYDKNYCSHTEIIKCWEVKINKLFVKKRTDKELKLTALENTWTPQVVDLVPKSYFDNDGIEHDITSSSMLPGMISTPNEYKKMSVKFEQEENDGFLATQEEDIYVDLVYFDVRGQNEFDNKRKEFGTVGWSFNGVQWCGSPSISIIPNPYNLFSYKKISLFHRKNVNGVNPNWNGFVTGETRIYGDYKNEFQKESVELNSEIENKFKRLVKIIDIEKNIIEIYSNLKQIVVSQIRFNILNGFPDKYDDLFDLILFLMPVKVDKIEGRLKFKNIFWEI